VPRVAALIFKQLGATIWSQRTRAEGLTETERRILDLANHGEMNKQRAAELHITVRTVESNLTRVYRKHGVSSRVQLTHLIRP
jgi:DNA-binding NarL/FixJ family response regulator